MTSFGWKRKIGGNVSKTAALNFKETTGTKDNEEEVENINEEDALKFVEIAKKRKLFILEDSKAKSKRLKNEGTMLAEAERYWEAIKKWDEALQLTPQDENLLEMKAQALMILHEVFPAVQTAEKTVRANCRWWVAHQTLGRAQMGLGEIDMAIKSFSRAIHIKPDEPELWEEDLNWACKLRHEKREKIKKKQRKTGDKVSTQSPPQMLEIGEQQSAPQQALDIGEQQPPPQQTLDIGEQQPPPQQTLDIGEQQPPPQQTLDIGEQQPPPQQTLDIGEQHLPSQTLNIGEQQNMSDSTKGDEKLDASNDSNRTLCNIDKLEEKQDGDISSQTSSEESRPMSSQPHTQDSDRQQTMDKCKKERETMQHAEIKRTSCDIDDT